MKAIKLIGKKQLVVADMDKPVADGKRIIIKVRSCGICGSDLHYWEAGAGMGGFPDLIMGHEFVGIIDDRGGRRDLRVGDRVTAIPLDPCGECSSCGNGFVNLCINGMKRQNPGQNFPGAYAEYVAIRPDMVRTLPDSISDSAAVMIEPAAVCFHAIKEAGVKRGDRVLVVGGGAIGLLCAAWARINGAAYIAITEMNDERAAMARKIGDADDVFSATDQKLNSKIKKATGGGVDVAIDTSASDAGINTAMMILKPRGTLILAGLSLRPQSLMTIIATVKELRIKPVFAYQQGDFDSVIDAAARGVLKLERFASKTIGPADAQAAFESLSSGKYGDVKIVINMHHN